jgi:membrane-associated phospholipid phosphatase
MRFLTDFADQAVILPLALVLGLIMLAMGWRRGAFAWWVAVGATLGSMLILKLIFLACGWRAPELGLHSPSGHTASAALVYGGLLGLLIPRRARIAGRVAICVVLALLFGTTRLALGAHSVPEVLVGGAVGLAGALLMVALAGERPVATRSWRFNLAIGAVVLVIGVALHGRHLGAERMIDRLTFHFWPLSECHDPTISEG